MGLAKKILGFLCILCGIGIFAYPIATTSYIETKTEEYIETFDKTWQSTDKKTKKKKEKLYSEICSYNQSIYSSGQEGFRDAWSYTQPPFELKGLEDGKFGYIEIPAMDVKLPLYIGASDENLSKGAAILGQTSIPIGGINTNSVIAGHRGYQGIPYFREIEKLETGDVVYIKNPWERLEYYVESIAIIDPYDSDAVKIQPGKDMVTLVTCHPYRSHGKYRYVVYCVRDKSKIIKKAGKITISPSSNITFISSTPDIKREAMFRKVCGVFLIFLFLFTILKKVKKRREAKW